MENQETIANTEGVPIWATAQPFTSSKYVLESESKLPDSITFEVDEVNLCEEVPMLSEAPEIFKGLIISEGSRNSYREYREPKFEDHSHRNNSQAQYVGSRTHGFLGTVHTAYAHHYNLQLSPSDFIILIGQGLSQHIGNNAEELRKCFVNHEGKEPLIVARNEFVMGKQNDWSTVFGEFSEQIKAKVKTDIYDVVIDDTSVATPTSRIVSEINLMDCMKQYFEYVMMTGCGIPKITLKGTSEDWEKLREKVNKLVKMNQDDCLKLGWWLKHLVPVIQNICDTGAKNTVDTEFWKRIYKFKTGYMSCKATGWALVFFPYLKDGRKNTFEKPLEIKDVSKQISDVPLKWMYYGKEYPMKIHSGFLGGQFDEKTFTLQPTYFWCIVYDQDKTKV